MFRWRKKFVDDVAAAVIDGLRDAEAESADDSRVQKATGASWGALLLVGLVELLALISSAAFALLLSLWGSAQLSHRIAQRQFDEAHPEAMSALEGVRAASEQSLPKAKEAALEAVAAQTSAHDGLRWWWEIGLELEPWVVASALLACVLMMLKVVVAHREIAIRCPATCCSTD